MAIQQANGHIDSSLEVTVNGFHTSQVNQVDLKLVYKRNPDYDVDFVEDGAVRYLKTTTDATLAHLSAYLGMRDRIDLGQSSAQMSFRVLTANSDNVIDLENSLTLRQVIDTHWRSNSPLELYYTAHKN